MSKNNAQIIWDIYEDVIAGAGDLTVESGGEPIPLDKAKLESHQTEIARILLEQDPKFFKHSEAGGYTFLQLPFDGKGNHWCEQPTALKLCILGLGLGLVEYLLPREVWSALPGGVPYLAIENKKCAEITDGVASG